MNVEIFREYVGDLYDVKLVILYVALIAVCLSIVFVLLIRFCAGVMVWLTILLYLVFLAVLAGVFFQKYNGKSIV